MNALTDSFPRLRRLSHRLFPFSPSSLYLLRAISLACVSVASATHPSGLCQDESPLKPSSPSSSRAFLFGQLLRLFFERRSQNHTQTKATSIDSVAALMDASLSAGSSGSCTSVAFVVESIYIYIYVCIASSSVLLCGEFLFCATKTDRKKRDRTSLDNRKPLRLLSRRSRRRRQNETEKEAFS